MNELQIRFGWKRRLKIFFGVPLRIFFERKIEGTYVDSNGDMFVELKPKRRSRRNNDLVCLFG